MQVLVLVVRVVSDASILVFEELDEDGVAVVFVEELPACDVDEPVCHPSRRQGSLHMDYERFAIV